MSDDSKAQELLDEILTLEAHGWTMGRDALWRHPEHTGPPSGIPFEEAIALEGAVPRHAPVSQEPPP